MYSTVPLPLPLAPDVTVIHETLLVAVQAQPAGAVTVTGRPGPPNSSTRLASWIDRITARHRCCRLSDRERVTSDRQRAHALTTRIRGHSEANRAVTGTARA